ncbi:MAG: ATP-binding protein [Desulfobacterales bacterium]
MTGDRKDSHLGGKLSELIDKIEVTDVARQIHEIVNEIEARLTDVDRQNEQLRGALSHAESSRKENIDLLLKRTAQLETKNKELINACAALNREQHQRLYVSRRLVELLEKERFEIANTLHENFGQEFVALKMDLEMLEHWLPHGSTALEPLKTAQRKAAKMIQFLREFSEELRPGILDTLGLVAGIRSMVHRINKHHPHIVIRFSEACIPEFNDPDKKTAMYRIVQEALANCINHAEMQTIDIHLEVENHKMCLTVEDDGKGFDYDAIEKYAGDGKYRQGISIMRERAVQFNGDFWIDSEPGGGTTLTAWIPTE